MFNQARRILLLWSKRRNPEKKWLGYLFEVAHSGLSKWMIGSFDKTCKGTLLFCLSEDKYNDEQYMLSQNYCKDQIFH